MKVGDLVVLSARGSKLQCNIAITYVHRGYGMISRVQTDPDSRQLLVRWFNKDGKFYRMRYFNRYELKKKKV